MIEHWMLSVLTLGALVALGGTFLAHLSPLVGLPRRWLWLALMLVSVSLPVVMALRKAPVVPPPVPMVSIPQGPSTPSTSLAQATTPSPNSDGVLLVGWGVASLLLAGIFSMSHRRIRIELATYQRRELLGATVAVSPDFGPAAVGILRSEVVLPEWVFDLPREEQKMVLRHELEHIRAGDHFVLLTGVVLAVLMPWNLGLWWQLRRLRVGMEVDCDARVAPTPRDRPRYAELLLRARNQRRVHRLALALVPAPSALGERLLALLEWHRPTRRQMTAWSVSTLACAGVLLHVPVPSVRPLLQRAAQQAPIVTASPIFAGLPTDQRLPNQPSPVAGRFVRKSVEQTDQSAPASFARMDKARRSTDSVLAPTAKHIRYDLLQPIEPGMLVAPTGRGGQIGVITRFRPDSTLPRNR